MAFKNKTATLVSVWFVTMISVPMIVSLIQTDQTLSPSEKRWLSPWPKFSEKESYQSYFSAISDYANDHFGFREHLIRLKNRINLALNQSPVVSVIKGREDWLFYKIKDPLLNNYSKTKSRVKENLKARAVYIKNRHAQLASKSIAYQHMVVPNKMSLYSEYLPDMYSLTDIRASYRYFKDLPENTQQIYILDIEKALLNHKQNQYNADLYFKNDTHWNQLGAYYAYQALFRQIKRRYPAIELGNNKHDFQTYTKYAGDLANYIGLGNDIHANEPMTGHPNCTHKSHITKPKPNLSLVKCDINKTTILFIGDSFGANFYPFLGESAGSLYTTPWTTKKADIDALIDEIKPDLVIEEIVERSLSAPIH